MDIQNQPDHSRLILDINLDLRRRLEIAAEQQAIPLRAYIEELLERIASHDTNIAQQRRREPMSPETFQELLRLREQIKQNHPGQTFDDSTEIIRQMREERSQYLADL
jgi:hypothetical protein